MQMQAKTDDNQNHNRQSEPEDGNAETFLFDSRGYWRAVLLFLAKAVKEFPRRSEFTIRITGRTEGDYPGGATE